MMKRVRWTILGAGIGVALYLWLTRKAKAKVPEIGTDAVRHARRTADDLGGRIREALREGRAAFQDRHRELSKELLPRD